ncbi:MAG: hypothetical protein HY077_05260 [Elusimicrobia bacterium]|nr:hypothetical protein [Elusimicrobiota bacterium]
MSKSDARAVSMGILLLSCPLYARSTIVQEHEDLVEAADSATQEARKEGGELKARKESETQTKIEPACSAEKKAYAQRGLELSLLTPVNFTGSADKYASAKDAATRARDLATNELVRCAREAAKAKDVCAREFKALDRAEASYNDPGLKDADGALLRRASRAAENLELCFSVNDIAVPKGFVSKDRYRWAQAAGEEVVK